MSAAVIDLNELVAPDREVKLGEDTFKVPGDLPMEIYLQIQLLQARAQTAEDDTAGETAIETIRSLKATIADLLLIKLSDLLSADEIDKRKSKIIAQLDLFGVAGLFGLVGKIYGDDEDDAEDEAETDPTPAPSKAGAGTKSSSRAATKKSGSSAS